MKSKKSDTCPGRPAQQVSQRAQGADWSLKPGSRLYEGLELLISRGLSSRLYVDYGPTYRT